jgi:hypothetical protein
MHKGPATTDYEDFLRAKVAVAPLSGFEIDASAIHPILKPHQRVSVQWALRGGRRALFQSFGLGKTLQQLELMRLVAEHTRGRTLIVAPLGVRQEFRRDAIEKLGWTEGPKFIRTIEEADRPGVYITNYEPVRDGKLDPAAFEGSTLDEASVLRGFGGTKTFREFMRLFEQVPYRFVATHGVVEAAREKRDTLPQRIAAMLDIVDEYDENIIIWHDLEAERHAIEHELPGVAAVYGSQDLEIREQIVADFADGMIPYLAAKPVMLGSGCNLQRHCHRAIFLGIGFKFSDFIQAIHRIFRFLQTEQVTIHIIYAESERQVLLTLKEKWLAHEEMVRRMSEIIREYGLAEASIASAMQRSMGVERTEVVGDSYRLANNDTVLETRRMEENSVGLVLTSIPFSTQYEYTPSYNDFGHSESNEQFFEQMDYLTPELLRVVQPGRLAVIHVKDRIVPGGMTGLGFQTVYPFHVRCIEHYMRHGFAYMGMKTIVTDVVRENNQTYRLGWTEQCKDGSKMGCGMPEYLLLFRKPPTDNTRSYADLPVVKSKADYSRSRWQVDAHGFARSSGNRLLDPEEVAELTHEAIFKLFRNHSQQNVYDFEEHVAIGEALEDKRILPVTFMLLQPPSWHPDVWTDVTRMLTLNGAQSAKGKEMHLCPMQFDVADRIIAQYSMSGETVYDPFMGIGTVPYRAVLQGRFGAGAELNERYFRDAVGYCESAVRKLNTPSLFDALKEEAIA